MLANLDALLLALHRDSSLTRQSYSTSIVNLVSIRLVLSSRECLIVSLLQRFYSVFSNLRGAPVLLSPERTARNSTTSQAKKEAAEDAKDPDDGPIRLLALLSSLVRDSLARSFVPRVETRERDINRIALHLRCFNTTSVRL